MGIVLKDRLKNIRTFDQMTQKDLSDSAGINQARLSAKVGLQTHKKEFKSYLAYL